jgi:hypothetical protein
MVADGPAMGFIADILKKMSGQRSGSEEQRRPVFQENPLFSFGQGQQIRAQSEFSLDLSGRGQLRQAAVDEQKIWLFPP